MIVTTEVESVHGAPNQQRMIFFRCQDDLGQWHNYGPVITTDPEFDAQAHTSVVGEKVAEALAAAEASALVGG